MLDRRVSLVVCFQWAVLTSLFHPDISIYDPVPPHFTFPNVPRPSEEALKLSLFLKHSGNHRFAFYGAIACTLRNIVYFLVISGIRDAMQIKQKYRWKSPFILLPFTFQECLSPCLVRLNNAAHIHTCFLRIEWFLMWWIAQSKIDHWNNPIFETMVLGRGRDSKQTNKTRAQHIQTI